MSDHTPPEKAPEPEAEKASPTEAEKTASAEAEKTTSAEAGKATPDEAGSAEAGKATPAEAGEAAAPEAVKSTSPADGGRRSSKRRRLSRLGRRRIDVVAAAVLVLGGITLTVTQTGSAFADPDQVAGKPVPERDVEPIVAAALSCPALTPPRLAAQLMAASGFDPGAAESGTRKGVAGLKDTTWKKWRPWNGARRADREANILALAHHTCELVGQLRAKKVEGDLWTLAVAADRAGFDATVKANGVPASARSYVDRVSAYAQWYKKQDPFRPTTDPISAPPSTPAAIPVPDEYVSSVRAAGRICPTITPARIAAQIMVLSGFNPNLRSDDGGSGIAQFTPRTWARYQPSRDATVWKPKDAIPALGTAMCVLSDELTGLSGADPYTLALAAYQWGPDAVRQANGLPRANVPQLAKKVEAYTAQYETDKRLVTRKTTPPSQPSSPSSSSPSGGTPTSSSPPAPVVTSKPAPVNTAPNKPLFDPDVRYQIVNAWTGQVLELPGDDTSNGAGVRIQFWQNQRAKDQFWRIRPSKAKNHYVITNAYSGKSLGIEESAKENGKKVAVLDTDAADPNQQWAFREAGDGQYHFINRNSGKALDVLGDDLGPPREDGTWNGYWIEQWELQADALDQRWVVSR
ncbi:RICIN domain-containing protein [Pseudosporangium ferrugineum]|uniref:Transglycosylase-like protein with SLT domain n=1 Tax=Pseudosporangium ferrugineum TaxID=439699 RepID=A0A2T0S802_9ACTN|nr:RICIN domain-containing protein [Pseudosporangium ferrugineum]PRY29557.1 transglycosylase-like protein with SLT domain [Pseudosporangium ferrugineum]